MVQRESNKGFSLLQVIVFTFIASIFLRQINKDIIFNFKILKRDRLRKGELEINHCGEHRERNSLWSCINVENKNYFKYEIE